MPPTPTRILTTTGSRFALINAPLTGVCALAALAVLSGCAASTQYWPQWGGPNRDFKSTAGGLADRWPEDGPRKIWTRSLGPGYSSIVTDGERVYTMYRSGDDEVVIALQPDTGKTLWEHRSPASMHEDFEDRFGHGPNATPTLVGDRIYTVGIAGVVQCLDKRTGKLIWSKTPATDFAPDAPQAKFGCSSSPIRYKNALITFVGGHGSGIVALDLDNGAVLWKKHDFEDTYSSPILINVAGQDQIALLTNVEIVGIDPNTGDLLWRYPHQNQWKTNISTPVWGPDDCLFVSSSGDAGSRLLKLSRVNGRTDVREVWATRKMSVGQGTAVRVGDYIYAAAGSENATFIAAVNVHTGEVAWRQRGFAKATLVYADGKLIILDEDGQLALATATPKGLDVLARTSLFDDRAWTIPTLVGHTLYSRDRENIVALDLGHPQ